MAPSANSTFLCLQVLDGHNGNAAAIYTRDNLLNHVLSAMPRGLSREEWLHALPQALVAGFVKTDKEFQSKGMYLQSLFFQLLLPYKLSGMLMNFSFLDVYQAKLLAQLLLL